MIANKCPIFSMGKEIKVFFVCLSIDKELVFDFTGQFVKEAGTSLSRPMTITEPNTMSVSED